MRWPNSVGRRLEDGARTTLSRRQQRTGKPRTNLLIGTKRIKLKRESQQLRHVLQPIWNDGQLVVVRDEHDEVFKRRQLRWQRAQLVVLHTQLPRKHMSGATLKTIRTTVRTVVSSTQPPISVGKQAKAFSCKNSLRAPRCVSSGCCNTRALSLTE